MKTYVKPALEVTELRVDASLAATGTLDTFNNWVGQYNRAKVTDFNLADLLSDTSNPAAAV